jgi:hypothetical protein
MTNQLPVFNAAGTTRTRWLPEISSSLKRLAHAVLAQRDAIARTRADATQNLPHSDDVALDVVQQEVLTDFVGAANSTRDFAISQMQKAKQLIDERATLGADLSRKAELLTADLAKASIGIAEDLKPLDEAADRAERQFRHFQSQHKLTHRDPSYGLRMAWKFVFLWLSLFAVETAVNTLLLMPALPGGGLEAFGYASLLTIISGGLGMACGFWGQRKAIHNHPRTRRIGYFIIASCVLLECLWLGVAVHFRAVAKYSVALRSAELYENLPRPSGPDYLSFGSVGLLFFGLLIFIYNARKWTGGPHVTWDVYFDYEVQHKVWQKAVAVCTETRRKHRDACMQHLSADIVSLDSLGKALDRAVLDVGQIADDAFARAQECRDTTLEIIVEAESSLKLMRRENCRIRTAPPPAYFDDYPAKDAFVEKLPTSEAIQNHAAQFIQELRQRQEQLVKVRTSLVAITDVNIKSISAN